MLVLKTLQILVSKRMFCCANTKRDFCKVFLPQIPDAFWALIWHLAFWKKRLQSYHHSTVWSSLKINRLWCNFRLKNTVKCIYFSFEFLHNYRSHPMQKKPTFKNRLSGKKCYLDRDSFVYSNLASGASFIWILHRVQLEILFLKMARVQFWRWGNIHNPKWWN